MGIENQSFEDRKERIFDFMDEVKARREKENREKELANRPEAKLRRLELTKKDGVDHCLNTVMGTLYRNSLPMNDLLPQSTCINGTIQHLQNPMELQDQMGDFVNGRGGGNGTSYYVHEAIKRTGSPALKRLMEGCTRIVNEQYADKASNPETISEDDFSFKLSGESENKLNDLMDSLQLNDLSDVIRQNVKTTAINEIEAAKKEKETRDSLEEELSNNDDMTTESAIDTYLKANNFVKPAEFYQPTLFQGIMIGKFNTLPYTENTSSEPITSLSYYSERAFDALRAPFRSKKERELINDFKSYQGAYGRMLGFYKSNVQGNNHNQIVANCKEGLTSKKLSPKATLKLPDIEKIEAALKVIEKEHEQVLKDPKNNKGGKTSIVFPLTPYSIVDALKQYEKSVAYLNRYFSDPDKMQKQIEHYQSKEAAGKAKCDSTKEIKRVQQAVSGLLLVETTLVLMHEEFIKKMVEYSKHIVRESNRMTAKESAFEEAVKEYTMLSCLKALRLEDFDPATTKALAIQYANM